MKRSLALLTTAALLATPLAAEAAPKKKPAAAKKTTRTVTFNYQGTATVTAEGAAFASAPCATPHCFDLETVKGEKNLTVTIKDATGTPTGMQIIVDDEYTSSGLVRACGTGAVKLSPKSAHSISLRAALSNSCQALPTQGTITAVITNF